MCFCTYLCFVFAAGWLNLIRIFWSTYLNAMQSKTKRPYESELLRPRQRLRGNLAHLVATNDLSTNRVADIMRDVHAVDNGSFADVARLDPSANCLSRNVRRKLMKNSSWMPIYWAKVRCKQPRCDTVQPRWVAFHLVHEMVHAIVQQGVLSKILETDNMERLSLEHLRSCELDAQCKLLGLGVWADGIPCNWDRTETVDCYSLCLPGIGGDFKNVRLPITGISHKNVCAETWDDVCAVIKWSLEALKTGKMPTARHDNSPWRTSDCQRKKLQGTALQRAALVQVTGDWDWMAKVYGFPPHNLKANCCWQCSMTPDKVFGAHTCISIPVTFCCDFIHTWDHDSSLPILFT